MTPAAESIPIADAIGQLYAAASLPWPPQAGGPCVPVPLDRLLAAVNLAHEEVPNLTRAAAGAYLQCRDVHRPELLEDQTRLAGFLFANSRGGYILVHREYSLVRRRFTLAHA